MKVVLLLTLLSSCAALHVSQSLSPVTRVVELLKGLAKQVESEGKAEEDLYEDYVCWAQSVISQKEAFNAAGASKKDSLETYLADLAAGRIELTSERADLEKEIETLMADLEAAKALREKEKADFEAAEKEMNQALTALEEAIKVLEEATKPDASAGAAFLAAKTQLKEVRSFHEVQQRAQHLQRAVALGEKFLTSADSLFLKRVLTGDVPTWDWKKLNRKATFKMSYKARSTKIQGVLKKLHTTFSINLKEATDKENEAQATYDELKEAKGAQLEAAQEALTKMASEGAARGLTKTEAEEEIALLKQQIANDEKIIADTKEALELKKLEWKDRKSVREGEQAAISKAIEILYSDDARDLFKKSFASQEGLLQEGKKSFASQEELLQEGISFLQNIVNVHGHGRVHRAIDTLKHTHQLVNDERLMPMVSLLKGISKFDIKDPEPDFSEFESEGFNGNGEIEDGPGRHGEIEDEPAMPADVPDSPSKEASVKSKFQPVIEAIDKMIETLKGDEESDLKIKEECEQGRMDDTRDAIVESRTMDEMTDKITKLTEEIKTIEEAVAELKIQNTTVYEELKKATEMRHDEHLEFKKNDKDDKEAAELVKSATEVLSKFYAGPGELTLVQQPAVTEAGEAPPPPPATWADPYTGKQGESTGIIANLEMIHKDIEKDIADAEAAEKKAQEEFDAFKLKSEEQMKTIADQIDDYEEEKGNKQEDKENTIGDRKTSGDQLNSLMEKMKEISPNCEYFTVNYALREANRHIELDGLYKAKAILMGGKFTKPKDPNREIKPGDAASAM